MFDFTGNICYKIYKVKLKYGNKIYFLGCIYDRVYKERSKVWVST